MNVLFVPSIGLDPTLLERLAKTVDYPVKYKIAWNNGPTGALEDFRNAHPDWIVKESPVGNLGVAASWNQCAKLLPNEPLWLLMNEDAWFLPGYLKRICEFSDYHENKPIIYLNESQAHYCFVWTAYGKKQFGTFDENLWPAYYEDYDYRSRLQLGGVTEFRYALEGLEPLPHGKPRSGGMNYAAMLQGCGLLNRAYCKRKWGSNECNNPQFQVPYNDGRLTPRDWIYYPEHRAELYPLWRTFMEQNPSIYD